MRAGGIESREKEGIKDAMIIITTLLLLYLVLWREDKDLAGFSTPWPSFRVCAAATNRSIRIPVLMLCTLCGFWPCRDFKNVWRALLIMHSPDKRADKVLLWAVCRLHCTRTELRVSGRRQFDLLPNQLLLHVNRNIIIPMNMYGYNSLNAVSLKIRWRKWREQKCFDFYQM